LVTQILHKNINNHPQKYPCTDCGINIQAGIRLWHASRLIFGIKQQLRWADIIRWIQHYYGRHNLSLMSANRSWGLMAKLIVTSKHIEELNRDKEARL